MKLKLLILDFDDTLFPTTVYKINPDIHETHLTVIDNLVCDLIYSYIDREFQVCIITNSHSDWFRMIATTHLPRFFRFALFNNLQVISARDNYESFFPNNCIEWKINAFKAHANSLLTREGERVKYEELYVLSIGDSQLDMIATSQLRRSDISKICPIKTKFIKLEDTPNLELVTKQLHYLVTNIETLDSITQSSIVNINEPKPPPEEFTEETQLLFKFSEEDTTIFNPPEAGTLLFNPPEAGEDLFNPTNNELEELTYEIPLSDEGIVPFIENTTFPKTSTGNSHGVSSADFPKSPPLPLETMEIFFTNPAKFI